MQAVFRVDSSADIGMGHEIIDIGNYLSFEIYSLRKLFSGIIHINVRSLRSSGWIVEGERKAHYMIDGTPQDVHQVSCFKEEWMKRDDRYRPN